MTFGQKCEKCFLGVLSIFPGYYKGAFCKYFEGITKDVLWVLNRIVQECIKGDKIIFHICLKCNDCSAWPRLKLNTIIGLHTHHHPPSPTTTKQTFLRTLGLVGGFPI